MRQPAFEHKPGLLQNIWWWSSRLLTMVVKGHRDVQCKGYVTHSLIHSLTNSLTHSVRIATDCVEQLTADCIGETWLRAFTSTSLRILPITSGSVESNVLHRCAFYLAHMFSTVHTTFKMLPQPIMIIQYSYNLNNIWLFN